jgi:hypothetical protein
MSFKDQLRADLDVVFFADFGDLATVDGLPVTGHFSVSPHDYGPLSGVSKTFNGPAHMLAHARRGSQVVINGVTYSVSGVPQHANDIIWLPLD